MSTISTLEKKIGYVFKDQNFLVRALTHASMQKKEDNERLEFLGDRVLALTIASLLHEAFPAEHEGSLAKRLTALVQESALAQVAGELDLKNYVMAIGNSVNETIVADAVEAVIGAVYLDGGFPAAFDFISRFWSVRLNAAITPPEDPKSLLQEWLQGRGLPLPGYKVLSRSGADHAPVFEIELTVEGYGSVRSSGTSKRAAEKEVAAMMLEKVKGQS